MDSYPIELTHHVYPSMLVAGLAQIPSRSAPSLQRTQSSPSRTGRSPPSSSPDPAGAVAGPSSTPLIVPPTELFPDLCKQLADVFSSRGRNVVWDPSRGRSAVFHTVLVDHVVRLPPRKTRPTPRSIAAPDTTTNSPSQLATLPPRSPLSPLHPASPLFPDGLIAPIWARKHREIVPSIFVAFHGLVEPYVDDTDDVEVPPPASSTGAQEDEAALRQQQEKKRKPLTGQELKARDDELIKLISERKRGLVERGIKLTVVLLTSRAMLEKPQLESRLSYIRRSSGLDSKASLFVLTPVSRPELAEFVTSLQDTLFEHSLDYYREHARRVRRKRARYPPSPAVVQPILQTVAASRVGAKASQLSPLSREGWHTRADFKLAYFAELHCDYESALSHYHEAYDLLAGPRGMLASTVLLPPRTKRWAEAKVLCDAISVRIARLFLYKDNGGAALAQFRRHVGRFVELSSGWGIGDATFEFWSWLSKQYRLMGDVLDQATRLIPGSPLPPFQLPLHALPLPPYLLHPHIADHPQDYPSLRADPGALLSPTEAAISAGTTTAALLQGPGVFYYLAAVCAEERQSRFLKMQESEKRGEVSEGGAAALVHEKTIDHAAQVVESYERARDAFAAASQGKHTCFVAGKVASVYADSGQWRLALRTLERATLSYERDMWPVPLTHLLTVAITCAEQSEELHNEVVLLLQALAVAPYLSPEALAILSSRWLNLSRISTAKTSSVEEVDKAIPHPIAVEAARGPLVARVVFRHQAVSFGSSAEFQVTIEHTCRIDGPTLKFIGIQFKGSKGELLFEKAGHSEADLESPANCLTLEDLGPVSSDIGLGPSCNLTWEPGQARTFAGRIKTHSRETARISSVSLIARSPTGYELQLAFPSPEPLQPSEMPMWLSRSPRLKKLQWVTLDYRSDPTSCFIKAPSHKLTVEIWHQPIGFLDEAIMIEVVVKNLDREPLICSADVMLQAAYPGSQDEVGQSTDGQPTLSGNLKGLPFGSVPPGATARTTFFLRGRHRSAVRPLTVFVQSKPEPSTVDAQYVVDRATDDMNAHSMTSETVHDLAIPVQRVFRAEYSGEWRIGGDGGSGFEEAGEEGARGSNQLSEGSDQPTAAALMASSPFDEMSKSPLSKVVGKTAIVDLHAAFGVLSTSAITISDVSVMLDEQSLNAARLMKSGETTVEKSSVERKSTLQGLWNEGDRWGYAWQVETDVKGSDDFNAGATGHLVITWARAEDKPRGQSIEDTSSSHAHFTNVTRLPLPFLVPPHFNARVLVASPPVTHVLQPFTLVFVVVNPSSSQMDVSVFIDDSPAWVVGNRTLSIPGIPARGSRSVPTRLVPKSEGHWLLPRVRAFQQRSKEDMEAGLILNETQYGIPLHVRFRASAGATLSSAAMRAIASGAVPAEQEGSALSVLVLSQETSA